MNKLVLIGNGFDLAHGLKTKYSDFILWYLNDVLQKLVLNHTYSDDLVEASFDFNVQTPSQVRSIKEFKEFLKLYGLKNFRYKNDFLKSLIDHLGDLNWVDIESEYYASLIKFYRIIENDTSNKNDYINKYVKNLNKCLNALKNKLSEYLIIIESQPNNRNLEITKHIINEFGNISNKNTEQTLFLNFNYTSTLESHLDALSHKNYSTNYIHGKLNDDKNPLIFGYGDEIDEYYQKIENLNSNEFLNNIKSFSYFKTNNYQQFSKFINDDLFNAYIMGHSCGISDRILLKSIVENDNCNSIKILYHDRDDGTNDYTEKTQELSRHFRPEFKDDMRNKILSFRESEPLVKRN